MLACQRGLGGAPETVGLGLDVGRRRVLRHPSERLQTPRIRSRFVGRSRLPHERDELLAALEARADVMLRLSQALGRAGVFRHLADDMIELGDRPLVLPVAESFETTVESRPERLRPRQELLQALDPRGRVPVDALERGERSVLVDHEHGLVSPWAAQPRRERLPKLVEPAQPSLQVAAHPVGVLGEPAP